jgi:pimeloyl-ACP methyl ester carboxylesterase
LLTTTDGLKLEARIDRDESRAIQPLVFIAGGFGSDAFDGSTQPILTNMFIRHGFAVMRINFRGNGNSDGDLARATITARLEDLNAALGYIRKLNWVEYVGLCGNSYGGGLVFHEVAEHPEHKYKFLILLSPRVDTKARYEDDNSIDLNDWRQRETIIVHGQERHYSLYSDTLKYHPWDVAKNITIPTLFVHSDTDEVCPYEYSVKMIEIIGNAELVTLKNCNHQYKERVGEVADIVSDWLNNKGF